MKYETIKMKEVVDPQTGEVLLLETEKKMTKRIQSKEEFYMSYIGFMSTFYQIKGENSKNILIWLCCNAGYNTGIVKLTPSDRKQICEELNISNNSLTNSLSQLKKLNLIQGTSGTFRINPAIFWKGDAKAREDILNDASFELLLKLTPKKVKIKE